MTVPVASAAFLTGVGSDTAPVAKTEPSAEDASIAALTRRLGAGEDAAWREFHDAYFDRLLRYLFVVCRGDEHAARESLQMALVKIVRHARRFDSEEAWWSWLTVVARHCVVDGARRHSRYRALLARYAGFLIPTSPVSVPPYAEDRLPDLLEECLETLSVAERTLLAAKYHEGQPASVLAASIGCSEKAIESRLARLRRRVKIQLLQRLRHET